MCETSRHGPLHVYISCKESKAAIAICMNKKYENQEFKKVMFSISILNSNEKLVEYFMIHNS